ncbi:VOC family protein [Caulobacter sp. 602-2]|uniref:VOC family protein n=1 Tax=Caulobacter sp. 602-2 TaxID=2710887 RepID=A0A6G4R1T5_9CAUL|nr:VOC family protein [Caulobacter sp. 602-2]NGM51128.1 VOC family protein [Caulobacter sp. 602-2]
MSAIAGVPVAFVHVSDRQRALDFYVGKLGLAVRSSDPFGDFLEAGAALIRLTALPDYKASAHPVVDWHVEDIEAGVRALTGRGVVFTIYEGFGQDALGIWTAPGGGAKVAWFADPDGNVLSLSQG